MEQDTFYVDPASATSSRCAHPPGSCGPPLPPGPEDVVLRTHTSPMQVRAMEAQEPPIYIVVPGAATAATFDATHTPMFHQVEGLAVDEDITLADLQGTLRSSPGRSSERDREVRLARVTSRSPSRASRSTCRASPAAGRAAAPTARGSLCKGSGWIEILGAGMVDPNVFGFVRDRGYDPERVQGFAFGMGIERIAMLKHGVPDLRIFFENDLRFLEQF